MAKTSLYLAVYLSSIAAIQMFVDAQLFNHNNYGNNLTNGEEDTDYKMLQEIVESIIQEWNEIESTNSADSNEHISDKVADINKKTVFKDDKSNTKIDKPNSIIPDLQKFSRMTRKAGHNTVYCEVVNTIIKQSNKFEYIPSYLPDVYCIEKQYVTPEQQIGQCFKSWQCTNSTEERYISVREKGQIACWSHPITVKVHAGCQCKHFTKTYPPLNFGYDNLKHIYKKK